MSHGTKPEHRTRVFSWYIFAMDVRTLYRALLLSLLLVIPLSIYIVPTVAAQVIGFVVFVAPLWLPILLGVVFAPLWLTLVRSYYVANVPYVMLELKPGEDTPKSPRPMEAIFYALYHRVSLTIQDELLSGAVRMPWSFELASHAGTVRFFVRIPRVHRQSFEARLRSEYKDIDIDEPRDYARERAINPASHTVLVREYALAKPDPYPLKTYEAYDAEKKEQPFSRLLEKMVALGEHEYLFVSWMVRPHQRARPHFFAPEVDTLHQDATAEIARLVGDEGDPRRLPKEAQSVIAALEHALKKPSYDCGLRALYVSETAQYSSSREAFVEHLFDEFADPALNSIESRDPRARWGWPLSDVAVVAPWLSEWYALHLYRRRAFFAPPYYGTSFVLNTAELATMFHLPQVSRRSVLARARGVRLEPPANLPV